MPGRPGLAIDHDSSRFGLNRFDRLWRSRRKQRRRVGSSRLADWLRTNRAGRFLNNGEGIRRDEGREGRSAMTDRTRLTILAAIALSVLL